MELGKQRFFQFAEVQLKGSFRIRIILVRLDTSLQYLQELLPDGRKMTDGSRSTGMVENLKFASIIPDVCSKYDVSCNFMYVRV